MDRGIFRKIFTVAECIEPDRSAIWDWLLHTQIGALGGYTAMDLVLSGHGERVLELLKNIQREESAISRDGE